MSPISGLTNPPKSFLKLGQIRKGAPKTENNAGKDLDYFRVTFLQNVTAGLTSVNLGEILKKRFTDTYGVKPTSINVRFADGSIPAVWDANFECYKQGGLIAKAGSNENGPYWIFYRDPKTMEAIISDGRPRTNEAEEMMSKPLDLKEPIYKNSKGDPFFLEPVGRLKVVIPELADLAVGYFEFRPESPRDIRNISAELGAYDAIAKQYGKTISGIPFILRRREEDVPKRIGGKLTQGKSWVVHLDVTGEWAARALDIIEQLALPEIVDGEEVTPQLMQGEPVGESDLRGRNFPEEIQEEEDFEDPGQPEEQASDEKKIDPHSKEAVQIAMKVWNTTDQVKAAQDLWKKFPQGTPRMTPSEIRAKLQ